MKKDQSRLRALRTVYLSIIAVVTSVTALLYFGRTYRLDDAFIYADYIRNALAGHGLVFNIGEHVNALTSPFYTYLLLGLSQLTGNIAKSEDLIFGVSFLGALLIAMYQLYELEGPLAAGLGCILAASVPFFYFFVGMESALLLLMVMACLSLFLRNNYEWLAPLIILCVFTRFECALLIPIMAVEHRRLQRKSPSPRLLFGPVVILLAYLSLNGYYYGALLPASTVAKFGQGISGYWGHWPFAFLHAKYHLVLWKNFYILVGLCFMTGILGLRIVWNSTWNRIVFPFMIGLLAFYLLFNIPGYPWYYVPLTFFLLLYAGIGLSSLLKSQPDWLAHALIVCIAAYGIFYGTRRLKVLQGPDVGYSTASYRYIGKWFDSHTPRNSSVEASEIGVLRWYSNRKVIDMIGLTEPRNALFILHRQPAAWLAHDSPDYIVIHSVPYRFEAVAANDPRYTDVTGVNVPGYRVLQRRDSHQN